MHNYFKQYIKAVSRPLPEMAEHFRKENNYLKNLVNQDSVILDIGCGNGRNMKFLAPFVRKVIGIDYDKRMIEVAQENLAGTQNIELIRGDFFEANFGAKFDLVFALYNLLGSDEITPSQRICLLRKMITATRRDGRVIASVWSDVGIDFAKKYYPYIGAKVLKIEGNDVFTSKGIFKRFAKSELKTLANRTGKKFKIVELSSSFYLLDCLVE